MLTEEMVHTLKQEAEQEYYYTEEEWMYREHFVRQIAELDLVAWYKVYVESTPMYGVVLTDLGKDIMMKVNGMG